MKPSQIAIAVIAAITVGVVALVSAGGGDDGGDKGGSTAKKAPEGALRVTFAYSP